MIKSKQLVECNQTLFIVKLSAVSMILVKILAR